MLWLTRRLTGKDPLPARLLSYFPRGAIGVGAFELAAAAAPRDLDGRTLAIARIVASAVSGCPFCVDMNAATWRRAGLVAAELPVVLGDDEAGYESLGSREATAARYARALSLTPVTLSAALKDELQARFSPRELVVLATTVAQVNFWTRFNQGLEVPAAGFYDESACQLPERLRHG
jgi:AhpD family alkylhydroperoxidase